MESAEVIALPVSDYDGGTVGRTSIRRLVLDFYDAEHIGIRRYLIFLGLTSEAAQEIVQDSFLKLHEHLLGNGDRRNLRAWLYRVAHNLARNSQTASRNSRTDALSSGSFAKDLKADEVSAEESLLQKERHRHVREAMNSLSAAQRQCLLLRAQGLKYREIAEALNVSVSTAGENVQRGLERLKELI